MALKGTWTMQEVKNNVKNIRDSLLYATIGHGPSYYRITVPGPLSNLVDFLQKHTGMNKNKIEDMVFNGIKFSDMDRMEMLFNPNTLEFLPGKTIDDLYEILIDYLI